MLSVYLFDQRQGKRIEAWPDALHDLGASQVLWLDLLDPSETEECEVREALGLNELDIVGEGHETPGLDPNAPSADLQL